MKTPTPRTDAAVKLTFAAGHNTVCPNFARTLETELTALTTERDQLRTEAERFQRLQRFIDSAAAEMKAGLITFGGIAELRAECDQLRAENIAFRAAQKACEACDEPTAFEVRQFRAEMERLRSDCENETKWAAHYLAESIAVKGERDQLRAEVERLTPYVSKAILTHGGTMLCSPQVGVAFGDMRARAERAEAELATEREKAERYRLATLKLDAELATERARLDWLLSYDGVDWILSAHKNRKLFEVESDNRALLEAAMKEGAK